MLARGPALLASRLFSSPRAAVGGPVKVRDIGLLESAVHRPRASVLGHDAYSDVLTKAGAVLDSRASNHALVDGNKHCDRPGRIGLVPNERLSRGNRRGNIQISRCVQIVQKRGRNGRARAIWTHLTPG